MPGQLFNLSRYFKRKKNDQPQRNQQTTEESREVVTTTTASSGSTVGVQPYSGIGYPPGGGAPYSGIGYPSVKPSRTSSGQPSLQQTTVVHKTTSKKAGTGKSNVGDRQAASFKPQASSTMTMQKRIGMDVLTRLTQRSTQALMRGVSKAKQLHSRYVDTEHVLWGLLTDSGVYQIVSDLKVAPKEMQVALEKQLKPGKFSGPPQFSPRVKRVLELALSAARSLGYEFISPEHILLALAQESEGMAAQVMAKHGLTVDALNSKITGKKEKAEKKKEEGAKASALDQFTEDLTQKAKEGKLDPVVARSAEIERIIHILSRRTKNNPVLIGDAGVGKTAIVEGLAQRIASGDVPETLLNKRILQLDLMSLIAGARHRGEFEERLKNLIKEVKATTGQAILFIDEIHNMVGAGAGSQGTMDASNILKPSLARGELQTIGTTTVTEYRRYMEKDPALERRFQPILVAEPTVDQAIEMLRALRDKYEAFHKVSIPDEAIVAAVRLSQRYVGDRFLPDKAVDLIDEAASSVRLPAISLPEEIKSIQDKLKRLASERKEAENLGDSVRLSSLAREIEELTRQLEEKKKAYQIKKSTTTNVVTPEVIQEIVSRWTNIPISKLTESESEKLLTLEDTIHQRIIDQETAVAAVAEAVRRGRAGLKSTKRPIGSFIFMGPTGVGKTELAKALAEILFGSEEMMVRLDMTEYMEKHEVAKLIGAPPGYVGYEEGGQLTESVRRHPYSVVLLDEIEKAHPDVFNILIQILDDGRLTDNKGHLISFKNTIVICTSNIGTGLIQREVLGVGKEVSSVPALDTYVVSPTGREIVTLNGRMWERVPSQKSEDGWKTKLLRDYFAGNTVVNADPYNPAQKLPDKGFDTHLIAPSGEEMVTVGGRFWMRKSTIAHEWATDTLIAYFKNHMVVNVLPDQPEQQLPTVKLDTNSISPEGIQVITLADRFWRRDNLKTQDWVTGKLSDYLNGCVVVSKLESGREKVESKNKKIEEDQHGEEKQRAVQQGQKEPKKEAGQKEDVEEDLTLTSRIIRDPELKLPTDKWDVHLFQPGGEEIIIRADRFWKRKKGDSREWITGELKNLFRTTVVVNAKPEESNELLPVGQQLEKAKREREFKEDEKFSKLAEKLLEELRKFFRPELLNRFDEIIVFRPLSSEHMLAIVDLQFIALAKLLEEQNIGIRATVAAKRELAVLGYDPVYGARPLRRTIQREIENPISSLLIEGKIKTGDIILVDHDGNQFVFVTEHLKPAKVPVEAERKVEVVQQQFSCNSCGAQFETAMVAKATAICPQCASSNLSAYSSTIPSATVQAVGQFVQPAREGEEEPQLKSMPSETEEPVKPQAAQKSQGAVAALTPNQTVSSESEVLPDLSAYFGQDEKTETNKEEEAKEQASSQPATAPR